MTQLGQLRRDLQTLRRRRRWTRRALVGTVLVTALVVILTAVFCLDLAFYLSVAQRIAVLLLAGVAFLWAAIRFAGPWLGVRESLIDLALLVERQQRIDSDLVAAIQFEQPEARAWGSPELEHAVVSHVAEWGQGLDLSAGMPGTPLRRNLVLTAAALLAVAWGAYRYPGHVQVFVQRLLLDSPHYPTRTVIAELRINDQRLPIDAARPRTVRIPYGQELAFQVRGAGVMPGQGEVKLRGPDDGQPLAVTLQPADGRPALFTGSLPRLRTPLRYQLYLGDAFTDPAEIDVIPLPVVEPRLTAIPPEYARSAGDDRPPPPGNLQLAVLEGSRVEVEVWPRNKPLRQVTLTLVDPPQPARRALAPVAGETQRWRLTAADTPLARVTQPVRFEIQVTDLDGLSLETPLRGTVRLRADREPSVSAQVVHKVVLPTARPQIRFRVLDDYGIRRVLLHLERTREDGSATRQTLTILDADPPRSREQLPLVERYALDLSPLQLAKGDQLKGVLEAVDFRGSTPGRSAMSEPIVLQVSDESGVLAAIASADEDAEQRLTSIINRQLGIGESP